MLCREWSLVHTAVDHQKIIGLKCRCWTCQHCQPDRRRELIRRAMCGEPNTFITLTVNPQTGEGPNERRRMLSAAWNMLVKRIKRRYGLKAFPFLAVVEKTKAGEPHLHVLARVRWIDQRWLSAAMAELINAPIVDIRRIDGRGRAMGYVTKYVGKSPHQFGTSKRYWFSRDYAPDWNTTRREPGAPIVEWYVIRQSIAQYLSTIDVHGWNASLIRGGVMLTRRC